MELTGVMEQSCSALLSLVLLGWTFTYVRVQGCRLGGGAVPSGEGVAAQSPRCCQLRSVPAEVAGALSGQGCGCPDAAADKAISEHPSPRYTEMQHVVES